MSWFRTPPTESSAPSRTIPGMADTEAGTRLVDHAEEEAFYWVREFLRFGMKIGHAEELAFAGCDRHAVRDALEQGCDPLTAFQIYAPLAAE